MVPLGLNSFLNVPFGVLKFVREDGDPVDGAACLEKLLQLLGGGGVIHVAYIDGAPVCLLPVHRVSVRRRAALPPYLKAKENTCKRKLSGFKARATPIVPPCCGWAFGLAGFRALPLCDSVVSSYLLRGGRRPPTTLSRLSMYNKNGPSIITQATQAEEWR